MECISRWLDGECKKDAAFASKVNESGKTVEGCCNYILATVRESQRCGFSDDEVYGMARHFFDEVAVGDPGEQNVQRIVVSGHYDLTDEERKAAMRQAEDRYLAELKDIKKREAEAQAKAEKERMEKMREKRRAEQEQSQQMDLFGGI